MPHIVAVAKQSLSSRSVPKPFSPPFRFSFLFSTDTTVPNFRSIVLLVLVNRAVEPVDFAIMDRSQNEATASQPSNHEAVQPRNQGDTQADVVQQSQSPFDHGGRLKYGQISLQSPRCSSSCCPFPSSFSCPQPLRAARSPARPSPPSLCPGACHGRDQPAARFQWPERHEPSRQQTQSIFGSGSHFSAHRGRVQRTLSARRATSPYVLMFFSSLSTLEHH